MKASWPSSISYIRDKLYKTVVGLHEFQGHARFCQTHTHFPSRARSRSLYVLYLISGFQEEANCNFRETWGCVQFTPTSFTLVWTYRVKFLSSCCLYSK